MEELDRHINGGIDIKGKVSLPLLQSIFNPTAPGHDGAVLIENDQITKFGVHLPLSKRLDKISQGGTRHAAALGLSEHCDALIVIVSEERGVISVAQSGHLQQLDSADELKNRLQRFEKKHYAAQAASWAYPLQHIHLRSAITAFSLSFLLWFAIAYNADTIYRTYNVPIEYRNLNASNVVMPDSVPIQARVTLSGPEQAFQTMDPSQLAVSFNLDSSNLSTDSLVITQANIELPSDINLYTVSPRSSILENGPTIAPMCR
ncbi:MAG: diadenylate cyclase [Balneolaceae bacterium]|nr:diadenylate cyclase [Balneolaceae bacterium]